MNSNGKALRRYDPQRNGTAGRGVDQISKGMEKPGIAMNCNGRASQRFAEQSKGVVLHGIAKDTQSAE